MKDRCHEPLGRTLPSVIFLSVFIGECCGLLDKMGFFCSILKKYVATAAGKHLRLNSSTSVSEPLPANALPHLK